MFVYKPPIFVKFEDVQAVNFARSGGSNRSFDIEIKTRGDSIYTFSNIEKDEYSRLYEFLKSKKITVKSTGKMDASKLDLSSDNIDHYAETVKADAVSSSGSDNSMSSDDEDFNPDALEAKDAKEEYDSDPSDTGSESDEGSGSGSEGEKSKRRKEKAEKKASKAARKKSSAPSERKSKPKKKTKLPGQPKKPMSAYFLWLNEEGRELIKKENPGVSVTEVAKIAGTKWGSIEEDTKKKYEEMNKELKEKYEEDYKEWLKDGGEEALKQAKKDKKSSGGTPKKKAPTVSAGGSGAGFQSKEFIDDSDSSAKSGGDGGDSD